MSPIDDYLDRLLVELGGSARDVRRILAETEDHLREAAAEEVAGGLPEAEAERRAVERFGPPHALARTFGRPVGWSSLPALVRAAVPFGAIGLVAIGVSGLLAELFGHAFGPRFVAGDPPDIRYTAARCADFQEYFPGKSCMDAAAWHHWGEVVVSRVAVGVLGLIVLGGWLLYQRLLHPGTAPMLPPGLMHGAAAALYGAAAAVLLLQALNAAVMGGMTGGTGQWLSAGGVALAGAIAYGLLLLRSLGAAVPAAPEGTSAAAAPSSSAP